MNEEETHRTGKISLLSPGFYPHGEACSLNASTCMEINKLAIPVSTVNILTLSLLMSYIYGAPCKAKNFNVVYVWTYVWQR
jgi:hypothetical protein